MGGPGSTRRQDPTNQPVPWIKPTLRRNRWLIICWGALTTIFSAATIASRHRGFETIYLGGALASSWAVGALIVFRRMLIEILSAFVTSAESPSAGDSSQDPPAASLSLASLTELAARHEKLWPALAAIAAVIAVLVTAVDAIFDV